eukprot:4002227-Pyramimonas_sp.AAC.1
MNQRPLRALLCCPHGVAQEFPALGCQCLGRRRTVTQQPTQATIASQTPKPPNPRNPRRAQLGAGGKPLTFLTAGRL